MKKKFTWEKFVEMYGYESDNFSAFNPSIWKLKLLAWHYNDNEPEDDWINWKTKHQNKWYLKISRGIRWYTACTQTEDVGAIYFKREEDAAKCLVDNKALWCEHRGVNHNSSLADIWLLLSSRKLI